MVETTLAEPTLLTKLTAIQTQLKVPKGQRNNFGNYNYRNAEDILEAVKPLLSEHELLLTLADEIVKIGERYYVKATAELRDSGTVGSWTVTAYAREEETKKGMDGSQITGASSSYARKYALNGLFLIDDTKDSDSTNTHDKAEAPVHKSDQDKLNDAMFDLKIAMGKKSLFGDKALSFARDHIHKDRPETLEEVKTLQDVLVEPF
jgi:hypothetical protein